MDLITPTNGALLAMLLADALRPLDQVRRAAALLVSIVGVLASPIL